MLSLMLYYAINLNLTNEIIILRLTNPPLSTLNIQTRTRKISVTSQSNKLDRYWKRSSLKVSVMLMILFSYFSFTK